MEISETTKIQPIKDSQSNMSNNQEIDRQEAKTTESLPTEELVPTKEKPDTKVATATKSETIRKKFIERIKLETYDNKHIDRKTEKLILEFGLKKGLTLKEGLALLQQFALEKGLILEREREREREKEREKEREREEVSVFSKNETKTIK